MTKLLLLAAIVGSLSFAVYYALGLRLSLLDYPNHRSSHSKPTVSGAGLPLALVFAFFLVLFWWRDVINGEQLRTFLLISVIAVPGWLDDRYQLSIRMRLCAFSLLALAAVSSLGGFGSLGLTVAAALLSLAFLNAYNFMDGIDGLAVSQALFVLLALCVFTQLKGDPANVLPILLLATALLVCFLFWNWAPARLFLGDAGSTFIGLLLAVLVLQSASTAVMEYASAVALLAVLLADSGITLLSRLYNGEVIYQAHRSHVYQLLAAKFDSHAWVSLIYLCISCLVSFPVVVCIEHWPTMQWVFIGVWGLVLAVLVCISRSFALRLQSTDI